MKKTSNIKKHLSCLVVSLALVFGLVPSAAFAADPITTDVVIHKRSVTQDVQLAPHNGEEITGNFTGTNLEGSQPLKGIKFKYWKISSTASSAQIDEIKALGSIQAVSDYVAANAALFTGETETSATDDDGKVTLTGLAEGTYLVTEVNGAQHNVSGYLGVPFVLELPVMRADGSGYFGQDASALHVYPKNVKKEVGLDVETVDEAGANIGGGQFRVEFFNGTTWETVTSLGVDGTITVPISKYTLASLAAGEYRLINTVAPDGYFKDTRPVNFSVSAGEVTFNATGNNPNASFTPETATDNPLITIMFLKKPPVTKTEENSGSEQVGKVVTWKVTVTVPSQIEDFATFTFVDTLDSHLDYVGNVAVTSSGGTLAEGTHFTAPDYNVTGHKLTIVFNPDALTSHAGKVITVTFDTKINTTAVVGDKIPNDVDFQFDNGHGDSGTLKPPTPPTVWTGGAKFLKFDGKTNATLEGAEFKIATNDAGTTFLTWTQELIDYNTGVHSFAGNITAGQPIIMKSGNDGIFGIKGLKGGTYYLVETKAPLDASGNPYNLLREPEAFTVTKDSYAGTAFNVPNNTGFQIPQTGGVGTVIFTVVGLALMGLAVALFRRKKSAESSE